VVPVPVQPTAGHARALEASGAGWGCVGIACLGSWYSASLVCVCCVFCVRMRVPEVAWMLRGGRAVCAPDAAGAVRVEQGGELGARAAGVLAARA
jgi:hypothetical protein